MKSTLNQLDTPTKKDRGILESILNYRGSLLPHNVQFEVGKQRQHAFLNDYQIAALNSVGSMMPMAGQGSESLDQAVW